MAHEWTVSAGDRSSITAFTTREVFSSFLMKFASFTVGT